MNSTASNLQPAPQTALLMTGSELMSGDTLDTNSVFLTHGLLDIGINITEKVTVGDELPMLIAQIDRLSQTNQLIIINGGLGPTQDDLTSAAMAKVSGAELAMHEEAEKHVLHWCQSRGFEANQANLKQAMLPQGCDILADAPGSAAAFYMTINDCLVIATPGVPSELKHIYQQHFVTLLTKRFALGQASQWEKYQLFGIGESRLQELINTELHGIDNYLDIGFRAGLPYLELKLKPKATKDNNQQDCALWKARLIESVDEFIFAHDSHSTLAESLVSLLQHKQQTFSCAESCTGGLIASEITKVAGASSVFPGGVVSYSNTVKHTMLKVPEQCLVENGAVSAETVDYMLDGVLQQMQSDYAVAVSGIAGPGGGTDEKPTGTVWIAWGSHSEKNRICLRINFERQFFQQMVCAIALDLVRRQIQQGSIEVPAYLHRWAA